MTSTIKVDNIQDQCGTAVVTKCGSNKTLAVTTAKANNYQAADGGNIINQCGTTITIGASGDTVSLASGASQSGFGRSGSVDWQTGSIKTSTFTATSGEGYFCNTSGGAFTVNLPAGSAGAIVAVSDYTRTFQTNNLTVSPNGSEKIGGVAANAILSTEGQSATFVYVDGTEGWINVQETSNSVTATAFITATGGTITTSGNDKIHTFTGPGTFCVSQIATCSANNQVSYIVVAGGGGSGSSQDGHMGAGGGAGGFREDKSPVTPYTASPLEGAGTISVTATGFPIAVGGGGAGHPNKTKGSNGSVSTFSTITSTGGGGGGASSNTGNCRSGNPGGSGGGSGGSCQPAQSGGSGNTPPVSPPQGNNGGDGTKTPGQAGSGGGATAAGTTNPSNPNPSPHSGGAGATTSITASPVTYSAGGPTSGTDHVAVAGAANSGNGSRAGKGTPDTSGAAGGSGVVIIRYKFQ